MLHGLVERLHGLMSSNPLWIQNIYGTTGNAEQAGYTQVLTIPTFIYKANNSIHLVSKSEL